MSVKRFARIHSLNKKVTKVIVATQEFIDSLADNEFWVASSVSDTKKLADINDKYDVENNDYWDGKQIFSLIIPSSINFKIENLGNKYIYDDKILTTHYKLIGKESSGEEVNIDIWYDDRKNWVKMIFIKDGSEIEYFLRDYDEN